MSNCIKLKTALMELTRYYDASFVLHMCVVEAVSNFVLIEGKRKRDKKKIDLGNCHLETHSLLYFYDSYYTYHFLLQLFGL